MRRYSTKRAQAIKSKLAELKSARAQEKVDLEHCDLSAEEQEQDQSMFSALDCYKSFFAEIDHAKKMTYRRAQARFSVISQNEQAIGQALMHEAQNCLLAIDAGIEQAKGDAIWKDLLMNYIQYRQRSASTIGHAKTTPAYTIQPTKEWFERLERKQALPSLVDAYEKRSKRSIRLEEQALARLGHRRLSATL